MPRALKMGVTFIDNIIIVLKVLIRLLKHKTVFQVLQMLFQKKESMFPQLKGNMLIVQTVFLKVQTKFRKNKILTLIVKTK